MASSKPSATVSTRSRDAWTASRPNGPGRRGGRGVEQKTIADLVVEHDEFIGFKKRGRGTSVVQVGSFFPERKTAITSAAVGSSTPGILTPERLPGIVKPGVRTIRVRDLVPRIQTSNNAVEWVKENGFTNAASPTAETISKPESALTFSIDSVPVRTLAHWIPASRQVLDDFGGLQNFLNQRLIEGLKDIEDFELVAGDGTGQHLKGLSTWATAYDTGRNQAGDTRIDKLNHAVSQIEDSVHEADGIILHPADWRSINLLKNSQGDYILGGPQGMATPILWGVPVATSHAVTQGTFYVGSFRRHTLIADRMDAVVDISTEHADYFIRNMVAIRAEERIAFIVTRSDAVIYGAY